MPATPGLLPITSARTVAAAKALPAASLRTVVVASYPKSGTTWCQNIVYELLTRGGRELDHISTYCPFMENDKSWEFAADTAAAVAPLHAEGHRAIGARVFNSHLYVEPLPRLHSCRRAIATTTTTLLLLAD